MDPTDSNGSQKPAVIDQYRSTVGEEASWAQSMDGNSSVEGHCDGRRLEIIGGRAHDTSRWRLEPMGRVHAQESQETWPLMRVIPETKGVCCK